MRNDLKSVLCKVLAVPVMLTAWAGELSPAFAQETADGEIQLNNATSETDEKRENTIVVTAQKREQALNDVPIALQALGEEALVDRGIRDVNEIITFVPGASEDLAQSQFSRRYQVRGITQALGDSTIGYYVGDVAFPLVGLSGFAAPAVRAFDMQRVEVLRGPQSTLYGNGAMGGVIRFLPNKPDLQDFQAHGRVGYYDTEGGDGSHYLDGALSVPIVEDRLAFRVAASYEDVGGRLESLLDPMAQNVDEGRAQSIRATLEARPTDRLRISAMYFDSETETDATSLLFSLDPPVSIAGPDDRVNSDFEIISATVSYDFGFAELTSTTAQIETFFDFGSTFPLGPPIGNVAVSQMLPTESFNNETRLVSDGSGPVNWIVGVFYNETEDRSQISASPAIFPSSLQVLNTESTSLFGEISFEMMGGKLVPLVGLRYFTDDRDTVSLDANGLPIAGNTEAETFESTNPRFNLSYYPDVNSMYYINIAKGFRSGNFNTAGVCVLNPACEIAVDSDELWSYEVGAKKTLLDGQLDFDAAIYYQDWGDIRQGVPFLGLFQDIQVGDAELYGVDLGLLYRPKAIDGLTIEIAGNVNSSEFISIDPNVAATLLPTVVSDGDKLPFVPEWTLSTALNYEKPVGNNLIAEANVTFNHIEGQVGQFGGTSEGDARDLLGVRVGVNAEKVGLFLFGRNLLDEQGAIFSQSPAGGLTTFTQDRSRVVGVELSVKY